jgi:DUF4097 and DUF4098 domain-containing protein YvlB
MRPRSIVGPLILIAIGVLFLMRNVWPEIALFEMFARYWPFLLILWGTVRLAEVLFWQFTGRPLPASSVSGGEWTAIVLLCLFGSAAYWGMSRPWSNLRISGKAVEVFGETFDFPIKETRQVGKTPRIVLELGRGNAKIVGADTDTIQLTGHKSIRAYQQADADRADKNSPIEIVTNGDLITIRTNQERLDTSSRATADMEITVPRGASFEGRGKYGDFDVLDIDGTVAIISDNAGVRLQNLAGNARIELRRSDVIRASKIIGSIEIKGRGQDIDIDSAEGPVTIDGAYTGELTFRNLAKPVRFTGLQTEMRIEKTLGSVRLRPGNLTLENVQGPIRLSGKTRDIQVRDFSGELDVEVDNGDLELRPSRQMGKIDARTGTGNIDVVVPAGTRFELKAKTDRGEIFNDFEGLVKVSSEQRGARASGGAGGPALTLTTDRGEISLRKSDSGSSSITKAPADGVLPRALTPQPPPAVPAPVQQ